MSPSRALPLLAISFVTVLWAGNFTAGKFATDQMDPFLIAGIRILAGAAFFPLLLPAGSMAELKRGSTWRRLLPLALTGIFVNQFAFAAGIRTTTPTHSALVHAMIPVFVLGISWIFLKEGAGPRTLIGVALAIGGAVYLALLQSREEQARTLVGDLWTLVGAIAFAAYVVIGRRVTREVGPVKSVAFGFVMAAPISLPLLAWGAMRQDWSAVEWPTWAALGYMIVAATFVCYSLHMYSLSRLGALQVSVFTNVQPLLGTLIALAFGRDVLTWTLAAAGTVILLGVSIVQFTRE